jgi:very-short-patch-repair endonuclease
VKTYRAQPSGTVSRARGLRKNATDAEKQMWTALREKIPGAKFRRQVPIGPYYADFLCFSAKLVIEVDGGQHGEAQDYDARRTAFIEGKGYRVIRFWNNDVLENIDGVIAVVIDSLSPSPSQG